MSLREQRARDRARREQRLGASAMAGGRSGLPSPLQGGVRQGGGRQPTVVVGNSTGAAPALGETVTVSQPSQSIAVAGTDITWATIDSSPVRGGFADLAPPVSSLPINFNGAYYDLHLSFEWESYTGGGTVTVKVNGTTVSTVTATSGDRFARTVPLGACPSGTSVVTVTVSHTAGAARTLVNAIATLQLVDRASAVAALGTSTAYKYADNTVTMSAPALVAEGDLMVALISAREPTISTPAGWTRLWSDNIGQYGSALDYKVAGAADVGGSYSWTVTGGDTRKSAQVLIASVADFDTISDSSSVLIDLTTSVDRSVTVPSGGALLMLTGSGQIEATPPSITHAYDTSMLEIAEHVQVHADGGAVDTISAATERVSGTVTRNVAVSDTVDVMTVVLLAVS